MIQIFGPKKLLIPHSPQQLAEAKEYCITILPQIRSEYGKRNPSKDNSNADDDEDDDPDSVDREFYNDHFQNPDYQEDLTSHRGYILQGFHIYIPVMLEF